MDCAQTTKGFMPPFHFILLALVVLPVILKADPSVSLHPFSTDNGEAFDTAIASIGFNFLGSESFSGIGFGQSGVTPGSLIAPGVPAGPFFPNGTSIPLGLLIQTNASGASPVTPNPGSTLYASGPVTPGGYPWLGPNLASESMDLIIDPPDHRGEARALAFNANTTNGSDLVVKVYDTANSLVAQQVFAQPDMQRFGLIASGGPLFRVNLFAPSGFLDVAEIDLYVVPEPALSAFLIGLASLLLLRRRRP